MPEVRKVYFKFGIFCFLLIVSVLTWWGYTRWRTLQLTARAGSREGHISGKMHMLAVSDSWLEKVPTQTGSGEGDYDSEALDEDEGPEAVSEAYKIGRNLVIWQRREHTQLMSDANFHPLTAEQVKGVKKFLYFTGYPRSGHSIVGSFLDAHPNIILSYAFFLFHGVLKPPAKQGSIEHLLHNKTAFFELLHEKSYYYSKVSSSIDNKGYTLDVPGLWSGHFNGDLKVIGDKSAMPTTTEYSRSPSSSWFKQRYDHLLDSVGVPLMGIHVVRNPFDMIATHTMYRSLGMSWKKNSKWSAENKYRNDRTLKSVTKFYLNLARAMHEMVPLCKMNVLEVHNEDFVMNPRRELQRLCHFLEVDCSEHYLKACESKTYKKVSRTRDLVYWPPDVKLKVEEAIKMYPFFNGYTYEDDLINLKN